MYAALPLMGFAALNPSYELHVLVALATSSTVKTSSMSDEAS